MNMSPSERLILCNQYEILAKLNPEQAPAYLRAKTIVERGYGLQLQELGKSLGQLSRESCQEVIDTLEMHHAMAVSWENLASEEQSEFPQARLRFIGYSRSHEGELCDYVCFLLEVEKRFAEVDCPCEELSSDVAMRGKYQRMLTAWRACPRHYKLSVQELRKILNA